ncbi:MAG: hypothetical protein BWX80_02599 [Candidatus Hydrogenedentes bacterium ADurb.Bin101]|nr:MAG: hypothetical protein BWX80_02599 [Candidatus Hydrogenedentes bacterium ADurb.Bin101]
MGTPSIHSREIILRALYAGNNFGMTIPGSPEKFSANRRAAMASMLKSSSRRMERANSSTMPLGLKKRASSLCCATHSARASIRLISDSMSVSMPGRCTFTAMVSPVGRVARYTWLNEAEATGAVSIWENISGSGRPSSSSIMGRISSKSRGVTSSSNPLSSSATVWPIRSGRVLSTWPSLIKVGPSSVSALRRRVPKVSPASWGDDTSRMPCRRRPGQPWSRWTRRTISAKP